MTRYMAASSAFPRSHIPALDGLRGWAILLVLLTHLAPAWGWPTSLAHLASFGWIGVDLFFVLSGFLITGILLDSKGLPGYLKNFYARRILRIWPIYFLLLALVFLVMPHIGAAFQFPRSVYRWEYYVFYLQNILLYDFGPDPLRVTWSLAVEEQFYLVWPLLVLVTPPAALKKILVTLAVLSPMMRIALVLGGGSEFALYTHTFFRLDGLVLGSLLAIWTRSGAFAWEMLGQFGKRTLAASLPLTIAVAWAMEAAGNRRQALLGFSFLLWVLAITFTACLALTLRNSQAPRSFSVVDNAVFRRLGKVSYGLYIYHSLVFLLFRTSGINRELLRWKHNGFGIAIAALLQLLLAYALAELSWRVVESPILRLKRHFARAAAEEGGPDRFTTPLAGSAAAGN
jgi:peptidoglycan/LPS O-acetylase OafA/YrhL